MSGPAGHGYEAGLLDPIPSRMEGLVASFVAKHRLAGASAGVVIDQELTWSTGVGFADQETGQRSDARTLYEIASISKTFTASAVLQLRDEGRLGLDDPLVLHVPEFAAASNPFGPIEMVTLRHLLQHTSGLQSEVPGGADPREENLLSTPDLVAQLDRARVAIPPGTAFKYANLGFRLLGETVRRASGRTLHTWLRDELLVPLDMRSTVDRPDGALADRRARGYDPRRYEDRLTPARPVDPAWCEGDGDLWSTVEDLARWIAQQFRTDDNLARAHGQILAGPTIAEMQRPRFVAGDDLASAQGLGWHIWRRGEAVVVGHGGSIFGFSSHVCFTPADRVGAVVLINGMCDGHAELAGSLMDLAVPSARALLDRRATSTAPPVPTPPAWQELIGRYRWPPFDLELRIEAIDGRLVCLVMTSYDRPDQLRPTDDPLRFVLSQGRASGEELQFFRDPAGRIEGLNLSGWPFVREHGATGLELRRPER